MHAIIISENNTVFAKSDFWSKTRQPAPVSPTGGNNTIPYNLSTLLTFETLKSKYSFATNVLIVTCDESPLVNHSPDASEHSHFGT